MTCINPAKVFAGDAEVGVAGQLAKRVAEKLKLRQDVYLAELNLGPVYSQYYAAKNARRYEALPRFPGVERDFSVLLNDGTHFSDVTKAIQSLGIAEITSIEATDLFRGKNVPAGKYTLFTLPNQSKWLLIISKQTGEWGIPYPGEKFDFARMEMKLSKLPSPIQNFTITFDQAAAACAMKLDWETTRASIDLSEKK